MNRKKVAYAAVKHRNLEMLKLVFDVSPLSFSETRNILTLVVEKGFLDGLRYIHEVYKLQQMEHFWLITVATELWNNHIVEYLLDHFDTEPRQGFVDAMYSTACANDNIEVLDMLYEKGLKPSHYMYLPLNSDEVCRWLNETPMVLVPWVE